MTYKKFTPPVVQPTTKAPAAQKPAAKPLRAATTSPTTKQEIDGYLKQLATMVEKDPKKAAEVFKQWLDKPTKVVKPKRAA